MTLSDAALWTVIVALAVGTFLIRFSFLGMIGSRPLPPWVLRHLRYTGVAVLPALVAPLILFPAANGGQTDPVRILAAIATVGGVLLARNAIAGILAGFLALYLGVTFL